MLSKRMEEAINGQINKEMYSAYLYMSMSAHMSREGLKGISTWLMVQYHEEMFHAMRLYEYVLRQGGNVSLATIQEPVAKFGSLLALFDAVLKHEQFITKSINDLMDLAISDKDHASQTFLSWYITEQVEEEQNANDIIQKLGMVGENKGGLYMLDKEIGARAVTVPTDFSLGVEAAVKA